MIAISTCEGTANKKTRAEEDTESVNGSLVNYLGGKTAMNKTQMHRPLAMARVIEFPRLEEREYLETDSVEARLKELMDFAEGFGRTPLGFLLEEGSSVRKTIEELIVKVNALDWIARVAKRSTGRVRESLSADIEKALDGLEETAELLIRAEEEWTHSDASGRREPLVCMDRF